MDLVVDANVFISALISSSGKSYELLFSDSLRLFAPEYLKGEIEKHKLEIAQKAGMKVTDIDIIITLLSSKITFISFSDFEDLIFQAKKICPDPDDVEYFAIALKLGCPLWSNEKKLKGQKEVIVYATHELIRMFD